MACTLFPFIFFLYSSYSHAALDISITPKYLSTISKKVSGKSPNKSSTNHRFLPQLFSWFMQYKDLIDAKVPYLSKLSPGGPIPHNHGEGFDAALDLLPQQPGGPIPQNMAKTFDGPPTLERSGSEHRVGRFPPSLLRFLSPANGGTEGGVKTIEEGRGERWSPL